MKTKVLVALCAMFVCTMAYAGNPLKVTKGKDVLKTIVAEPMNVEILFDWSNATYDKKQSLESKMGSDYEWIKQDCLENFIEGFTDKSKNVTLSTTPTGAKYKYVLEIAVIDSYFAAMRFIPQYEGKMWGMFKIISVETGESVVEVKIDEAEDGCDFVWKECFGETFLKLGEKIGALKK